MNLKLNKLNIVLVYLVAALSETITWDYKHQDDWGKFCTNGKHQSPIALSKKRSEPLELLRIRFFDYEGPKKATIQNDGHTIKVKITDGLPSIVSDVDNYSSVIYKLDSFHFHWGSEHIIDRKRSALELHLVHYAVAYGNLTNALNYKMGVHVLSVLFKMDRHNNSVFDPILEQIPSVANNLNKIEYLTKKIDLRGFLPRKKNTYFRYDGSLTTPECNEVVVWTVFDKKLFISLDQVETLRLIQDEDGNFINKNYRYLQDRNNRIVYYVHDF